MSLMGRRGGTPPSPLPHQPLDRHERLTYPLFSVAYFYLLVRTIFFTVRAPRSLGEACPAGVPLVDTPAMETGDERRRTVGREGGGEEEGARSRLSMSSNALRCSLSAVCPLRASTALSLQPRQADALRNEGEGEGGGGREGSEGARTKEAHELRGEGQDEGRLPACRSLPCTARCASCSRRGSSSGRCIGGRCTARTASCT